MHKLLINDNCYDKKSFEEIENFHNEKHIFDLFKGNNKKNFYEIDI